jgi:apolipoprotein D and lipocalin family protein
MKKYLSLFLSFLGFSCAAPHIALESQESFDIKKYMGKWYEIARLPNSFEEGLEENTAFYELRENGDVTVINQGRVVADKSRYKEVKGRAWIPDANEPSKLKVSFFWPFAGDYWVLRVDRDYSIALVGDPSREYLWILARERDPDPKVVSELKAYASSLGYAVENMVSGLAD